MTLQSYTLRRYNRLVEVLIPRHDWMLVTIADGTVSGGDFLLTVAGVTFVVADPVPGADSSAAVVTEFINAIQASSVPVSAFAGSTSTTFRLRHDHFGGQINPMVDTTDEEGAIRVRPEGPTHFDMQFADNWDAVFTSVEEISSVRGFVSPTPGRDRRALDGLSINANQLRKYTRVVFDLADFGRIDADVQFFKFIPMFGAVPFAGETSSTNILLTEKQLLESHTMLSLVGTAPAGATLADALPLELPRQISSYTMTNTGGVDLLVSFGAGTAELTVAAGESIRDNRVNISTITLRGDGGATTVDIAVTLNAQRML
jgi:hypothetical protein